MAKIRTAVICPVHRDVKKIASQIDNYSMHHELGEAFHVVHLSQTADEGMRQVAEFTTCESEIEVNDNSWPTNYRCVFGSMISNSIFLESKNLEYTHVYSHTDGDLIVEGDLSDTIHRSQNCFQAFPISSSWVHYKNFSMDSSISRLFEYMGVDRKDALFGRQEGAFFQRELWREVIDLVQRFFEPKDFMNSAMSWPVEEVLLATIPYNLLNGGGDRRTVIRTKELATHQGGPELARGIDDNAVTTEDVLNARKRAIESGRCVGLKWFSPKLDDPARLLAMNEGE